MKHRQHVAEARSRALRRPAGPSLRMVGRPVHDEQRSVRLAELEEFYRAPTLGDVAATVLFDRATWEALESLGFDPWDLLSLARWLRAWWRELPGDANADVPWFEDSWAALDTALLERAADAHLRELPAYRVPSHSRRERRHPMTAMPETQRLWAALEETVAALVHGEATVDLGPAERREARRLCALAYMLALSLADTEPPPTGPAQRAASHERTTWLDPPPLVAVLTECVLTAAPPLSRARATHAA